MREPTYHLKNSSQLLIHNNNMPNFYMIPNITWKIVNGAQLVIYVAISINREAQRKVIPDLPWCKSNHHLELFCQ